MNSISSLVLGVLLLLCIAAGGLYGCPQYNVYSARLAGEATLAEAPVIANG